MGHFIHYIKGRKPIPVSLNPVQYMVLNLDTSGLGSRNEVIWCDKEILSNNVLHSNDLTKVPSFKDKKTEFCILSYRTDPVRDNEV